MSIYPLETCPKCSGSGRDEKATQKLKEKGDISPYGHIRCSLCNGEGKY
jgi:DnaJ-class molecular chaperone